MNEAPAPKIKAGCKAHGQFHGACPQCIELNRPPKAEDKAKDAEPAKAEETAVAEETTKQEIAE